MSRYLCLPLAALIASVGCTRPVPPVVQSNLPQVTVANPIEKEITDYEDFTGRTVASKSVEIKARVTGELMKIHFKDGSDVKAGDPLFDIDDKTYLADWEKARAAVMQAQARTTRLERDFKRAKDLEKTNSISPEEVDRITGDLAEAVGNLKVAERQVDATKNYVDYTHIKSPISGRISKREKDVGNLVKADDTLLTTIVATDALYADFDIDDQTHLKLKALLAQGKIKSSQSGTAIVKIGLPNSDDFSKAREGTIIFEDNQVNPGTGTIRVRATMDNTDKLLSPGLFVRVRLNIGAPKASILVPEVAINTDQGLKYVFVVNDQGEVEKRGVKLGLADESMRVVSPEVGGAPLAKTDRVIVKGLQSVREKAKVTAAFEKPAAPAPPPAPTTIKG